ncbi:MAG: metal-binding protein, partial [Candidatus Rokuibacteriota bacterium]
GICGSGLIDAVAAALDAGLLDWTGLLQVDRPDPFPPALGRRIEMRGEERVLVLVPRGGAAGGGEIVLTQEDVRQVQLAKGAIASGIQ